MITMLISSFFAKYFSYTKKVGDLTLQAVDIFAAFSTAEKRLAVVKEIAKMWSVGPVETLYPINRSVIQVFGIL